MKQTTHTGLGLIELLLVLGIISILIGITLPSYQHFILLTNRQQAEIILFKYVSKLEQFTAIHHTYQGAHVTEDRFSYHFDVIAKPNAYILSANPKGPQKKDRCKRLSIDNLGRQFPVNQKCW